jgi:hypothetical protein
MIAIDFFGCKREQIVACSWQEACDRFPCAGLTIPSADALTSLSTILTGSRTFSTKPVPLSTVPFYEFDDRLKVALKEATAEDLMDAGTRWAELPPWEQLNINPMDLAGFLLHLQSLVHGPGKEDNSIFLSVESGGSQLSELS